MKKTVKPGILVIMTFLAFFGCKGASIPYSYPDPEISIDNMKQTVQYLSTISPHRNYKNIKSLEKSAQYISEKLISYGLAPKSQKFEVLGNTYENVIASVGPEKGPRMVVGAHYDVCGDQPGADDNASAVAGLLEIARFLKKHASELSFKVDFVAYTLEEPPFFGTTNMGSYVHAKSLHENNISVRGMICLEMIGYFTEQKNSQKYPLSIMRLIYPATGNFISVVSNFKSSSLAKQVARHLKATPIKVETLKAPSFITGVDFSDHRNYWEFGYDAVMITDTAFYRNSNYHKPSDTMDTLDFDRMKEVVTGICWSLLHIK